MQRIFQKTKEAFPQTETVITLLGIFIVILGVDSFVLYPAGITYSTYPLIHFFWLVFGMTIVEKFAPLPTKEIKLSKAGGIVIVALIILGLATSVQNGELISRSVKIVEILFQDLVIATILATIGERLLQTSTRVRASIVFALLHVPLFFTEPWPHVTAVVGGALLISFISTTWFAKTKQDISTIVILHLAFYLVFGTALTIVFW
jgi:hypothetical protein